MSELTLTCSQRPDPPLLHIHAQHSEHNEAYILGNRMGLEALRRAIDVALTNSTGESEADVMVSDGEGYSAVIVLEDARWNSPVWRNAAVPYIAEHASEKREDAIWPWNREEPTTEDPTRSCHRKLVP